MYPKTFGCYFITNKKTGFSYIGATKNICDRINRHFCELKANKHCNSLLQNDFNKYGNESFIVTFTITKSRKDALIKEAESIVETKNKYNKVRSSFYPIKKNKNFSIIKNELRARGSEISRYTGLSANLIRKAIKGERNDKDVIEAIEYYFIKRNYFLLSFYGFDENSEYVKDVLSRKINWNKKGYVTPNWPYKY